MPGYSAAGSRRGAPRDDLGDPQAELLVDDHDLAARDRLAVDQQVDGLAGQPVQRDDRAGAERERLADRHPRAADLHGQLDGDVAQAVELAGEVRARGAGSPTVASNGT